MEKYYFDVGIFITPILKNREKRIIEESKHWLKRIATYEIEAFTSYLTWDELIYLIYRDKKYTINDVIETGKKFLSLPNINFIEVGEDIIKKAQEFVEEYHIKPRDSIHASTALLYSDSNLVTLDVVRSDFKKIKDKDGNLLLKIKELI